MAKEPIVKIDGNQVDKVLSVTYGIANQADADGRPTKNRRSIGITVRRIADDNKNVATWAESSAKDARKGGTVEFFHEDGTSMKTLEWEEGYVLNYQIGYDQNSDHAVESFTVMSRTLGYGGDKVDYKWEPGH